MNARSFIALLAIVAALGACGGGDGAATPSTAPATSPGAGTNGNSDVLAPPPGVLEREWIVVAIVDGDDEIFPPEDVSLTLEFDNGMVAGSAGCNEYRGDAVLTAARIDVSSLEVTERACADVEDWTPMLAVLEAATHVELLGDSLFVWADDDRALFLR